MKSINIPYESDNYRAVFSFSKLYSRVKENLRASWLDLHCGPGIYVVYLKENTIPSFTIDVDNINLQNLSSVNDLNEKWKRINKLSETDILYIGKGKSLRSRIRSLMRFGHGKTSKHFGGEWLWQLKSLNDLLILTSSCPLNQEKGYERWLIDKFIDEHKELPLCNRKRGDNVPYWIPK